MREPAMLGLAISGYVLLATGFYVLMCRTARYREETDSGIPQPRSGDIIDLEAIRRERQKAA
ncbi:MAG: hypothetical protein N2109_06020 [Fimbriimonadales bacterium]|nr:hypothetical protein [Fimbriimonadales bacterium]